jgi:hypothetical protein
MKSERTRENGRRWKDNNEIDHPDVWNEVFIVPSGSE